MGDVIALSDITPSGAADRSQEPSPAGSRRGRITPNLSRASSDADHGVSRRVLGGVGERDRLTDWGEQGGTGERGGGWRGGWMEGWDGAGNMGKENKDQ